MKKILKILGIVVSILSICFVGFCYLAMSILAECDAKERRYYYEN